MRIARVRGHQALVQIFRQIAPSATEQDLGRYAEALALSACLGRYAPQFRGTDAALAQMATLRNRALKLQAAIEGLGDDEWVAMRSLSVDGVPGPFFDELSQDLIACIDLAKVVERRLEGRPSIRNRPVGAPADELARSVERQFRLYWINLTGGEPEPSAFQDRLREVYGALGVAQRGKSARYRARCRLRPSR